MHPDTLIAAYQREKLEHKGEPEFLKVIDKEIAFLESQPRPLELIQNVGYAVADFNVVMIRALRCEMAEAGDDEMKIKAIQKELDFYEGHNKSIIERAVQKTQGRSKAVAITDPEE